MFYCSQGLIIKLCGPPKEKDPSKKKKKKKKFMMIDHHLFSVVLAGSQEAGEGGVIRNQLNLLYGNLIYCSAI